MSEATHYWPSADQPGAYRVWAVNDYCGIWDWDGSVWYDEEYDLTMTTEKMKSMGYLGVRREAEKPDNAATAQQALDEWRACRKSYEYERWSLKWGNPLCEIAGAR